jgi:hypothetical protein
VHSTNWNSIEFIFTFKLNINPEILDKLEFYRIENILQQYEDYINKENEEHTNQQKIAEKEYGKNKMQYDPNSLGKNIPTPNYGGFQIPKMPSVSLPNISYPKI